MTKKENEKQNIEIAILKEQIKQIKSNVDKIMTNHLPHIQQAIEEHIREADARFNNIEKKLALWSGSIIGAIAIIDYAIRIITAK